jgi:hypothetical protein
VIDLRIDLLTVGVRTCACCQSKIPGVVSSTNPLMNCCVETIAAIKGVGVGHQRHVFLRNSGWVHAGAELVPSRSLYDRIRTIGPRGCLGQRTENAEVSQLPCVRTAGGIRRWANGISKGIDGRSCGRAGRGCRRERVSVSPTFPISEDAVSSTIGQNNRPDYLALAFKLLIPQDKKERLVLDDRTAQASGKLLQVFASRAEFRIDHTPLPWN